MSIEILDCTLRDGGYYTNWNFPQDLSENYFTVLNTLPIDYIEVGYRSTPMAFYFGEYFYCPEYLLKRIKELCPKKKLAIILNEKDTTSEDLDYLLTPCKGIIDLVRMAIDPANFDRAVSLAKQIKNMGFDVAFNVMYMSEWKNNPAFLDKIPSINGLVSFFYMVDSYGGILPDEIKEITKIVQEKTNTSLGFHGHNNLEMALINSLTAIECGCKIIDCTITGMGRGAGNLKTELLITYLASKGLINAQDNGLSDLVSNFEYLQKEYEWGTNLPYMISGAYSLPQKDVMSWISKKRYSTSNIINALNNRINKSNDTTKLQPLKNIKQDQAIIIGGGTSASSHFNAIKELVHENHNLTIIHSSTRNITAYNTIETEQYFCLPGNEAYKLTKYKSILLSNDYKFVYPPSPRQMGTYLPPFISDDAYELNEINIVEKYKDSPLAIALQTAIELGCQYINLVGFDGYSDTIDTTQFELTQENQYIIDSANKLIKLTSWTPTRYKNIKVVSIYSLLK
ncbi:aldolase catalytic domain-containing protein [Fulvivirga ulvae]|uniref:aldolase catalytic domain-containing protein n=1 Tax=Fulvivirga ulvae TaxID=2904245 RepID=UPI001F3ACABE|nr:aldolase catalytic domain-containing protein [Fulvivirga ulvae]UII34300.1 aldolase catalytic domain-containing protein [Fulvivirga ulvae]